MSQRQHSMLGQIQIILPFIMLLSSTSLIQSPLRFKFPSPTRIIQVHITTDNTLLLLCKRSHKQHALIHMNLKGQQLWKYIFKTSEGYECSVLRMNMLDKNTAILLVPRNDEIVVVEICKKNLRRKNPEEPEHKITTQLKNKEQLHQEIKLQSETELQTVQRNLDQNDKTNIDPSSYSCNDIYTYHIKKYWHSFRRQNVEASDFYLFNTTKLITVVQKSMEKKAFLKLTYYKYPLSESQSCQQEKQPKTSLDKCQQHVIGKLSCQAIYDSEANRRFRIHDFFQQHFSYNQEIIQQGNQSSLVIWFNTYQSRDLSFCTFRQHPIHIIESVEKKNEEQSYQRSSLSELDIRQAKNGWGLKSYKIKHSLGELYEFSNLELVIRSMHEIQPDVIMVWTANNYHEKSKYRNTNNKYSQTQKISQCFTINLKTSQLTQPQNLNQTLNSSKSIILSQTFLSDLSIIHTVNYSQGHPIPSPVYYISNLTQDIVFSQPWLCSNSMKYKYPSYEPNMIHQFVYANGQVGKIIDVKIKKQLKAKEVFLFFLQQIYHNWDQDLLQESVEIISYEAFIQLELSNC